MNLDRREVHNVEYRLSAWQIVSFSEAGLCIVSSLDSFPISCWNKATGRETFATR